MFEPVINGTIYPSIQYNGYYILTPDDIVIIVVVIVLLTLLYKKIKISWEHQP